MIHLDPALIAPDPVPAATPADAAAPADARALIEGQMAMLTRLAQVGMELVEAVGREAKTAPVEAGLAFARVARAVRMTIALQSRLAKDLAALDRADHMAEKARTTRRRIRLSQLVEDAARAKMRPGGRIVSCGRISQAAAKEPYGIRNLGMMGGRRMRMGSFIVFDYNNSVT